ncbi:MAG: leucine-rich repeat domain-containing protein [Treponemataceae bacterium]|nr:leucine-rich repeat domain-containing protein [Treponemataceae bacterium]
MKKPERFAVCMAAMATLALIFAGCSDETDEPDPGIVYDAGEWVITDTTAVRYRGTATEVNVPDGVTFIGVDAFEDCGNLKTVAYGGTLAQWCALDAYFLMKYAGQVTMSDGTDLKHMTTLAIPDGVRSIGDGAFKNCAALTSVTIPASVVIVGGRAFADCTGLTDVTIPEGVTDIGYSAFWGCTSLASVKIPEGVTEIGGQAFYEVARLKIWKIPAWEKEICG